MKRSSGEKSDAMLAQMSRAPDASALAARCHTGRAGEGGRERREGGGGVKRASGRRGGRPRLGATREPAAPGRRVASSAAAPAPAATNGGQPPPQNARAGVKKNEAGTLTRRAALGPWRRLLDGPEAAGRQRPAAHAQHARQRGLCLFGFALDQQVARRLWHQRQQQQLQDCGGIFFWGGRGDEGKGVSRSAATRGPAAAAAAAGLCVVCACVCVGGGVA